MSSRQLATDTTRIPSACRSCPNGCGIVVYVKDGVVVKIEGNPDNPHNSGRLCAKGLSNLMLLYDPNRLKSPLKRTNPEKGIGIDPQWSEISWEEALRTVTERLASVKADDPRKLMVLQGTGEPDLVGAGIGAFASTFGTPNAGTGVFYGTHTQISYLNTGSMHTEPDFNGCRYLILFGSQKGAVAGHDTLKTTRAMADARARGMKIVAIDPISSPIVSKADEWVPVRPGTDGALALSLLHMLLNELESYDEPFLARQTNAPYLIDESGQYLKDAAGKPMVWDGGAGKAQPYDEVEHPSLDGEYSVAGTAAKTAFRALREHLGQYTPERAERITTVAATTIRRIAREFAAEARIGSTTLVDGKRMPFRPVCAFSDSRVSCHRHGMWTGTAIHLLNVAVGAVDVPGGNLGTNIVGPQGVRRVGESPEGLVTAGPELTAADYPYPGKDPHPPETIQMTELFPVARGSRPMLGLSLLKYPHLLPYQPEVLLHHSTNALMVGADSHALAEALKRFPFMVSIGHKMDETMELADVVLPVQHHLERLDFPMNSIRGWVTGDHWYYALRQPAAAPPSQVPHVMDLFLEMAARLDLQSAINVALNSRLRLKEPARLEEARAYRWEEILDLYMRSTFGPEHDLHWFKQNGVLSWQRDLAERYPRGVLSLPRVPLYFEHLIHRGQQMQDLTAELELDWDLSDYQPLPLWAPCAAHEEAQDDYDLFAINYKLPFQTASTTQANPWLEELTARHRFGYKALLNEEIARHKGIRDGDAIFIESSRGQRVAGVARLTQCVHPEVVGIAGCFGHWSRGQPVARGKGTHFNSLVPLATEWVDILSGYMDQCVRVKVGRA